VPRQIAYHLISTVAFFAVGLTLLPRAVKRINKSKFNVLARQAPVSYTLAVLLAYCVLAGLLQVNLVFAAFLAGFAVGVIVTLLAGVATDRLPDEERASDPQLR
jgi:Kef-type K+ transport system membrane component KefB